MKAKQKLDKKVDVKYRQKGRSKIEVKRKVEKLTLQDDGSTFIQRKWSNAGSRHSRHI